MIGWMAYAAGLAGLLGLAALALERVAGAYGRPTRWLWAGALAGSIVVPAIAHLGFGPVRASAGAAARMVVPLGPLAAMVASSVSVRSLDVPLTALWLCGTLTVLAYLAVSLRSIGRRRRGWRRAEVEGSRVWVSRTTGPAVVGLLRSEVVLPEWALRLDRAARGLLLAHEREHARSGDPRVLAGGLIAIAAMPWNPVLWWQLRRLRLAVEVDCDARVLRRGVDPRRYGALLLEVGRRSLVPVPMAVTFSVRRSQLEHRIRALVAPVPRHRTARAVVAAACAAVVLAAACAMPLPSDAAGEEASEAAVAPPGEAGSTGGTGRDAGAVVTPYTGGPELLNGREVLDAFERFYPPLLRDAGIGGEAVVWLLIDEDGRVLRTRIKESSDAAALDEAAVKIAEVMRFSPARNRDERVKVWVSVPIRFSAAPERADI